MNARMTLRLATLCLLGAVVACDSPETGKSEKNAKAGKGDGSKAGSPERSTRS